ncbi:MAG: aspartate kinase [Gemmatimonadales bacterium]
MSSIARLSIIKVGGGLSAVTGALDAVGAAIAAAGRRHRIAVVPGGGPFADAVRAFEHREPLSADAAHWMAILGMDQYAHVLAERIDGAVLVEEPETIGPVVGTGGVAVLAPFRWMRAADPLPHAWTATSDSVAAFVAGALNAERLVLVKPAEAAAAPRMVDAHFASVLPAGLPWEVLGWERIGELERILGRTEELSPRSAAPPSAPPRS